MPQDKDLKLDMFHISSYAYRELKYFCRQYYEKKHRLLQIHLAKEQINAVSKKEILQIEEKSSLEDDLFLIEQTASEVAGKALCPFLLQNVTQGTVYEYMPVPCGRKKFYELRRQFFALLYYKKNGQRNHLHPIS